MISFAFPDPLIFIFSFCLPIDHLGTQLLFAKTLIALNCREKMQARSDMATMINIPSVSSKLKSVVKLLITEFEKKRKPFLCM